MVEEFVHHPMNQEITAISGFYELIREERLMHRGQEVLYVVGHGVFDGCCGVGGCAFALVPGFIRTWKAMSKGDLPVSQVEPVASEGVKKSIRSLIRSNEAVTQVNFL